MLVHALDSLLEPPSPDAGATDVPDAETLGEWAQRAAANLE